VSFQLWITKRDNIPKKLFFFYFSEAVLSPHPPPNFSNTCAYTLHCLRGMGQFFQHLAENVCSPLGRIKADGTIMAIKKHCSTPHPCRKQFEFRTCAAQLCVTIDPALFHFSSKPSQIPFINHNGELRCGMTLNRRASLTVPLYAKRGLSLWL
jgi:hypothetical protein